MPERVAVTDLGVVHGVPIAHRESIPQRLHHAARPRARRGLRVLSLELRPRGPTLGAADRDRAANRVGERARV